MNSSDLHDRIDAEKIARTTFTPVHTPGTETGYIELPDGYRIIIDENGYVGRYDPNLKTVI